jgi:lysophospholipase L1-like esterase
MSAQSKFRNGLPVAIAIVGDSCGCGFGANRGVNVWADGNAYGAVNQPDWGPNWVSGNPHSITKTTTVPINIADNKQIPSAAMLLQAYLQASNPASVVYNRSRSGWTAADHVANSSIAVLAAQDPKPDAVIIALGINDAKHKQGQGAALRTLINQCISNGMTPIISKGHNVACDPATGAFTEGLPNTWVKMPYWLNMRAEMESIAAEFNLQTIDPGTPDNALDTSLLYDPFHPSGKGHNEIARAYIEWVGKSVMIHGFRFEHQPSGEVSIGDVQVKLGGSGPVRINTSLGVKSLA